MSVSEFDDCFPIDYILHRFSISITGVNQEEISSMIYGKKHFYARVSENTKDPRGVDFRYHSSVLIGFFANRCPP
jgi:hypothetical protein